MHKIVKTGDFSRTLERAGCKQPKSTRLLREFQGVFSSSEIFWWMKIVMILWLIYWRRKNSSNSSKLEVMGLRTRLKLCRLIWQRNKHMNKQSGKQKNTKKKTQRILRRVMGLMKRLKAWVCTSRVLIYACSYWGSVWSENVWVLLVRSVIGLYS